MLHPKKQYPKGMLEYESADEPQTISGIYFSPDLFAANRSPEEPVLLSLPTE